METIYYKCINDDDSDGVITEAPLQVFQVCFFVKLTFRQNYNK